MGRIPYEFTRDSVAALIKPHGESRLVQPNIPVVGYPGVRGGGGFLIMPAVTQLFYDNYLSNQTLDAAVGAPWTIVGTVTARDENTLLGSRSAEVAVGARFYQTKTLSAAGATVYVHAYCPPPARIDLVKLWWQGVEVTPSGIVSLGGYWYLVYYSATAAGTAQQYGISNSAAAQLGPIWVDCLSLTQTAAPVGFVPNSQTDATRTSVDDNLKFTLSEPLPQSGSISFVYVPFYDNDGSAVDDYPVAMGFYSSGGYMAAAYDYFTISIRDANSTGFYVTARVQSAGGTHKDTIGDGYAGTGFKAFEPIEMVIDWDFTAGGTKLVRFWVNGGLVIESNNLTDGISSNLVDLWVGCQKYQTSAWQHHAQGIIQDIQIHRR